MELGARLHARKALVYNGSNLNRSEVVESLACLSEIAAEYIGVVLEPVVMGRTRTLAEASAIIRDTQVDSLRRVAAGRSPGEQAQEAMAALQLLLNQR